MSLAPAPRVLLLGTRGRFSAAAFADLLRTTPVSAVAVPGRPLPHPQWNLPVSPPDGDADLAGLAQAADVPVLHVDGPEANGYAPLAEVDAELIFIACWPWRLPASVYSSPRLGCLNLHPSLLPAYRGPDPLFWQFHDGVEAGGVTLHQVAEHLDAGPVALQTEFPLRGGLTEQEASQALGALGGQLALEALARVQRNDLSLRPQEEDNASAFGWPSAEDFRFSARRSARRGYNFIRAMAERGQAFEITALDGRCFRTRDAMGYDADAELGDPWRIQHGELWLQCTPGVLRIPAPRVLS